MLDTESLVTQCDIVCAPCYHSCQISHGQHKGTWYLTQCALQYAVFRPYAVRYSTLQVSRRVHAFSRSVATALSVLAWRGEGPGLTAQDAPRLCISFSASPKRDRASSKDLDRIKHLLSLRPRYALKVQLQYLNSLIDTGLARHRLDCIQLLPWRL